MLTQRKQQGFIIRKGRKIDDDKQDRKKYMSQTQFFRKRQSTPGYRSPGSILHVKFKEDIGMIKSRWVDNPQPITDTKFNYQQSENNLKQRGDQFNKNQQQLDQMIIQSRIQKIQGLNLQNNLQVAKILQQLNYHLHHRLSASEILKSIKQYLQFISIHQLGSVNGLNVTLVRKKILKQSLINERLSILLIGFIQASNLYDTTKSYIINLAAYALDNLLLRLAILSQGKQKQVIELLKEEGKQDLLNRGFETVKNNNQIMSDTITKVSKADNLLYENMKKIIKANKTLHVKGQFSAIQQYFAFFMHMTGRAENAPFLAIAPAPYLQPQDFDKYTLVIDVIECFCSHNKKSAQSFRPFAQYFLDQMSQYYQIVSFSDAMPNQVNKIIGLLDRKKHIKHRLYRHHLDKTKSFKGKDLTRLGRQLNTMILIDTSLHSNPNNTIVVSPWKGKKNDAQLAEVCPILAMMALKKLNPQKTIKKLHQKNEENHKLGLKYQNFGIDLQ